MADSNYKRKPKWLTVPLPKGEEFRQIQQITQRRGLPTVCEEAKCPNLGECWSSGTATFMLLGETCTRACRFCSVQTQANPAPPDPDEPQKIALSAKEMGLKYLVLTTVNRDELPDQGVGHMLNVLQQVQSLNPQLKIELLMPDFCGDFSLVDRLLDSPALVLGHNLECVSRLSPKVRDPKASYQQSLDLLSYIKKQRPEQSTKSSLLVGLGETQQELFEAMADLRKAKVDFLTVGQYLQPTKSKLPVIEYIHPDQFHAIELAGKKMGFRYVAAGPLVRSSYKAFEYYMRQL